MKTKKKVKSKTKRSVKGGLNPRKNSNKEIFEKKTVAELTAGDILQLMEVEADETTTSSEVEIVDDQQGWAKQASKFLQFLAKHKTLAIIIGTLIGVALVGLIVFLCVR